MKREIIVWENEEYCLSQLLKKLDIPKTSFYRHMKKSNSTIDAINKCINNRRSPHTYLGKPCSVESVASKYNINPVSLYKYINQGLSLDEIIPIVLENKNMKYDPNKKVKVKIKYFDYQGEMLPLIQIAKRENISSSNLYRRVIVENESLDTAITEIKRNQKIRKHYSRLVDEKARILMVGDVSLFKYCADNKYNYRVIINKILKYNMKVDEAIEEYIRNGQDTTRQRVFYKHGDVILRHLLTKYNLNSSYGIKLKDEYSDINDLIVKLCFSGKNDLYDKNEGLYLYELYSLLSICNADEKEFLSNEFKITVRQKEILEKEHKRISYIQREFLYYELEPVLKTCSEEDKRGLIELYGISDREIDYINNSLYDELTLIDTKQGPLYIKQPKKIDKRKD